jgi:hypothetical protein
MTTDLMLTSATAPVSKHGRTHNSDVALIEERHVPNFVQEHLLTTTINVSHWTLSRPNLIIHSICLLKVFLGAVSTTVDYKPIVRVF